MCVFPKLNFSFQIIRLDHSESCDMHIENIIKNLFFGVCKNRCQKFTGMSATIRFFTPSHIWKITSWKLFLANAFQKREKKVYMLFSLGDPTLREGHVQGAGEDGAVSRVGVESLPSLLLENPNPIVLSSVRHYCAWVTKRITESE